MQFTVYKSTDASAPVLSGTTGSLVALLDACLVTGYTGKTAAGWTKEFTGTSKGVYRAPGGVRHYFRVQDDGPGVGTFKEARITGYTAMTTVDAGTGPFPTAAQGVGGVAMVVARKSSTADATARGWVVLADARTVYVLMLPGDTAGQYSGFCFGEYFSIATIPSTARSIIIGRNTENSASSALDRLGFLETAAAVASLGQFTPAGYGGLGTSTAVGKDVGEGANTTSGFANTTLTYPNPADGAMYLGPVFVHEPSNRIGRMRGLWCPFHPVTSMSDGQTLSGSGALSAKTFLVIKTFVNGGAALFETSNTLDTN